METDFCLYFDFGEANSIELKSLQIIDKGSIHFKTFEKQEEDNGFRINTKTNLIEGFIYKEENDKTITEITGTLYNKCIESGDFFKIPVGEFELKLEGATASKIEYEYIYY